MNKRNPQVDGFLRKAKKWRKEMEELRRIVLECGLTEEVKWRHPCYTVEGKNVVLIGGFKEYCVLNFVKGSLLKDERRVLRKPGEDTQVSRVVRFAGLGEILELEPVLKDYVREAVDVEKSGAKVELMKITERKIPEELEKKFREARGLKKAFEGLTPGRQRAYLIHFSSAKQSATRESRIEKCLARIMKGKGMDD